MKIKQALKLGLDCDLSTVDEAVRNIEIHAGNMFVYEDLRAELKELYETWEKVGCDKKDSIKAALEMCENDT